MLQENIITYLNTYLCIKRIWELTAIKLQSTRGAASDAGQEWKNKVNWTQLRLKDCNRRDETYGQQVCESKHPQDRERSEMGVLQPWSYKYSRELPNISRAFSRIQAIEIEKCSLCNVDTQNYADLYHIKPS